MKVRSCLTAGVAAVAVSAVVAAPTAVAAPQHRAPTVAAPVALSAAVKPLVLKPVDVRQIATARDVITRLDPDSALAAAPAPQNVASDWITSGYEFIKYWVSYGVDLAQYVLQFIPFGGLIGAQIGIVYDSLVVPIADSVVYDLINPVVNNPLNLSVWVNGFVDVGVTSVNALINTGIAELNYFFGWLIPPLPFAAEATEATALKLPAEEPERTLLGAELTKHVDGVLADLQTAVKAKADAWVDALVPEVVKPDVQTAPEPAVALVDEVPEAAEAPEAPEVTEPLDAPKDAAPRPAAKLAKGISTTLSRIVTRATSSLSGVSAQGEVRGASGQPAADETDGASEDAPKKSKPTFKRPFSFKKPEAKSPDAKEDAPASDEGNKDESNKNEG